MTLTHIADPLYRRDLGDGLLLRWSTRADTQDIAHLGSSVFRDAPDAPPNTHLAAMLKELMSDRNPVMSVGDVALVEDTRKREHPIVACTCLWRQTWDYSGVPLEMGRPEIVATDPAYRKRGLVRAIFELIHARSETEGQLIQGITGIPYFYRQFGYEFALDLDAVRTTRISLIPPARQGVVEDCALREATLDDLPLLLSLYERQRADYTVATRPGAEWWRYQLQARKRVEADAIWHISIVLAADGSELGYLVMPLIRWRQSIPVLDLALRPALNVQAIVPALLRAIHQQGAQLLSPPRAEPINQISFLLGQKHPLYAVLGQELAFARHTPYAWYVRVPQLPLFIRRIAPVLERRLANSPLGSYSGELLLNFYRGGLRLVFEKGLLITSEDWQAPIWNSKENAGFPPLVFLQLLFGRRSLNDLRFAFPDVWANEEVELLLQTLFPASSSWVMPLG
jgi:Acetyltransferase (GNAT) domain